MYLAVSNHRGCIILFDIEVGQLVKTYHTNDFEAIACLGFCVSVAPDERLPESSSSIALARQDDILFYGDCTVKGLDINTWRVVVDRKQPDGKLVRAMAVNPGLRRIVTGNYDGRIRVGRERASQDGEQHQFDPSCTVHMTRLPLSKGKYVHTT